MEPKAPDDSNVFLAHWMGPLDANGAGNIHGGVVMRLCDEAAGLAAVKYCRQRVVTVGLDRMTFLVPVHVAELVTFKAMVNAAWRTSMEVGVRVEAENPRTGEVRHTTSAYLTMVCLDENGRPAPVPPFEPQTPEQDRRRREAELRRANRLHERDMIAKARSEEEI